MWKVGSGVVAVLLALATPSGGLEGTKRAAGTESTGPLPRVTVTPAVVRLGEAPAIAVTAAGAVSLEVRLQGASDWLGRPSRWTVLRFARGAWRGTLYAPIERGIYPLQLRTGPNGNILRSNHWLVRVFAAGTRARPAFDDPEHVLRWWVGSVRHATLVASRPWPLSAIDHRDRRLHRLFVVAYRRDGTPALGMFVTVVREGYRGRWRLLEATVEPPVPLPSGLPS